MNDWKDKTAPHLDTPADLHAPSTQHSLNVDEMAVEVQRRQDALDNLRSQIAQYYEELAELGAQKEALEQQIASVQEMLTRSLVYQKAVRVGLDALMADYNASRQAQVNQATAQAKISAPAPAPAPATATATATATAPAPASAPVPVPVPAADPTPAPAATPAPQADAAKNESQRRSPRIPLASQVTLAAHPSSTTQIAVNPASAHNFFVGFTKNISNGGLFIETNSPLPVGQMLTVFLNLPGNAQPLPCQGKVAWILPYDPAAPRLAQRSAGMGVTFTDLAKPVSDAINAYLAANEPLFFPEENDPLPA